MSSVFSIRKYAHSPDKKQLQTRTEQPNSTRNLLKPVKTELAVTEHWIYLLARQSTTALNLTTVYWVKTIRSCLADKHACVLTSGFWHSWVTATSSQPADDVALQCGQWGKPCSHGSAETTSDTPSVTLHSAPAQTRFGLLSNKRYHIIFFVAGDLW